MKDLNEDNIKKMLQEIWAEQSKKRRTIVLSHGCNKYGIWQYDSSDFDSTPVCDECTCEHGRLFDKAMRDEVRNLN